MGEKNKSMSGKKISAVSCRSRERAARRKHDGRIADHVGLRTHSDSAATEIFSASSQATSPPADGSRQAGPRSTEGLARPPVSLYWCWTGVEWEFIRTWSDLFVCCCITLICFTTQFLHFLALYRPEQREASL